MEKSKSFKGIAIALGVLMLVLLGFGAFVFTNKGVEFSDVTVTNLRATSASIVWTTEEAVIGSVVVSETNSFPAYMFSESGENLFHDDRDVEEVEPGVFEIHSNSGLIPGYTHHVTIRNLEPEKEYFFALKHGRKVQAVEEAGFTTTMVADDVYEPDPMYGMIINEEEKAIADGLVLIKRVGANEESQLLSTFTAPNGTYSMDLGGMYTSDYSKGFEGSASDKEELSFIVDIGGKIVYDNYTTTPDKDQPVDNLIISNEGTRVEGLFTSLVLEVEAARTEATGSLSHVSQEDNGSDTQFKPREDGCVRGVQKCGEDIGMNENKVYECSSQGKFFATDECGKASEICVQLTDTKARCESESTDETETNEENTEDTPETEERVPSNDFDDCNQGSNQNNGNNLISLNNLVDTLKLNVFAQDSVGGSLDKGTRSDCVGTLDKIEPNELSDNNCNLDAEGNNVPLGYTKCVETNRGLMAKQCIRRGDNLEWSQYTLINEGNRQICSEIEENESEEVIRVVSQKENPCEGKKVGDVVCADGYSTGVCTDDGEVSDQAECRTGTYCNSNTAMCELVVREVGQVIPCVEGTQRCVEGKTSQYVTCVGDSSGTHWSTDISSCTSSLGENFWCNPENNSCEMMTAEEDGASCLDGKVNHSDWACESDGVHALQCINGEFINETIVCPGSVPGYCNVSADGEETECIEVPKDSIWECREDNTVYKDNNIYAACLPTQRCSLYRNGDSVEGGCFEFSPQMCKERYASGTSYCSGWNEIESCNNGVTEIVETCTEGFHCVYGPDGIPFCGGEQLCSNGMAYGDSKCVDIKLSLLCDDNGDLNETPCGPQKYCEENSGECTYTADMDDGFSKCENGNILTVTNGSWITSSCPEGYECIGNESNSTGAYCGCELGSKICVDSNTLRECKYLKPDYPADPFNSTVWVNETCENGCSANECKDSPISTPTSEPGAINFSSLLIKVKAQDSSTNNIDTETILQPGVYEIQGENIETQTVELLNGGTIKLYSDLNGNGIKDIGENYIVDTVEISTRKLAETEEFSFSVGWNLVHLPLVMVGEGTSDISKASELLTKINSQDGNATHITTYRGGKFLTYSQRLDETGNLVTFGDDFNLIPGEGYFIKTSKDSTLTVAGVKVEGGLPVTLEIGWNLVGIYNSAKEEYMGFEVLKAMNTQGVTAKTLSKWQDGGYSNLVYTNGTEFGNDYKVYPYSGYWVQNVGTNTGVYKPE